MPRPWHGPIPVARMDDVSILIASAPHADTFGYSMPPPGLLRLGGALERRGWTVRLDDLAFALGRGELPTDDRLADAAADRLIARAEGLDVLGLSVMGATLPIALAILERVRDRAPRLALWLGGPGTTGVDHALIERFAFVDLVVRGEGEEVVTELLERGSPEGVRGVTWRDAGGAPRREDDRPPFDLSDVAPYAWHLLPPIAEYKALTGEAEGLVPIDSGRGCVYDCSFCTIGRFWQRRSRTLPVDRLVDEISALAGIDGARNAYLCHDLFGADRRHAMALCATLVERGVETPWEVRARLDHLDDELIGAMADAGCYRVLVGVESGDGGVRNANHKRMDPALDVVERLGRLGDAGIVPILSLILGLPSESDEQLRSTLDLCVRACLRTGVQLSLHLVNPQPGTELGERYGAESRPVQGIAPDMAFGTGETAPERALIAAHPDLFSSYALLTGLPGGAPHLERLHRIAVELPQLVMRYPLSVALAMRRRSLDALDLFEQIERSGRSFEALCALERAPLVDACLAWEQAKARAGSGPVPADAAAPRLAGQRLRVPFDLARLGQALAEGAPLDRIERPERTYLVIPTDTGVRTVGISDDVDRVLALVDGRSAAELERAHPGLAGVLDALSRRGLVVLPRAQPTPNTPPHAATSTEPGPALHP